MMPKSGGGGSFAGSSFASNQSIAQKARGGKHGYIGGVKKSKDSMQRQSSVSARTSNDAMRKNFTVRNSKDAGPMTTSTNGPVKTKDGQRPRINRGTEVQREI